MGEQSRERSQEDAELDAEVTEAEWVVSHAELLRQIEQRRDERESARESEAWHLQRAELKVRRYREVYDTEKVASQLDAVAAMMHLQHFKQNNQSLLVHHALL